ncbi:MAG: ATP-binding protein [Bacteroidota bacterium]|nr:ATP-binding protein [Bacteroidota bacterium]
MQSFAHKNFLLEKNEDLIIKVKNIDVFLDKEGLLTYEDIISLEPNAFVPAEDIESQNFSKVYWIKFDIENFEQNDYIIITPNNINEIDIYFFDPIKNKLIETSKSKKTSLNFSKYLDQVGIISISKLPVTYYVRIESIYRKGDEMLIITPILKHFNNEFPNFIQRGVVIGLYIFLIFVCVLMIYITKETSFIQLNVWLIFVFSFFTYHVYYKTTYLFLSYFFSSADIVHYLIFHLLYFGSVVFFILYVKSVLMEKNLLSKNGILFIHLIIYARIIYLVATLIFQNKLLMNSFVEQFFIAPVVVFAFLVLYQHRKYRIELIAISLVWLGYIFKIGMDNGLYTFIPSNFNQPSLAQYIFFIPVLLIFFHSWQKIRVISIEKQDALNNYLEQLEVNQQLKDELNKDLGRQISQRSFQLEEKNKQLDSFVFAISHYIRGPVATIKGLVSIGKTDKSEQVREYFRMIENASQSLENIFTDVNKILTIDKWPVKYEINNLEEQINKVIMYHSSPIEKMNIEISIPKGVYIFTDRYIINEIMNIIIQNAFDFSDSTKEHSFLHIYFEETHNQNIIYFADNGIGMNENIKENIFNIYYRGSVQSKGTGVGLYICKIACEKINAKITFESEEHKGSIFKIEIPKG